CAREGIAAHTPYNALDVW
nr:immunoglobulin heavy chain junction region [Macaca mulatta]